MRRLFNRGGASAFDTKDTQHKQANKVKRCLARYNHADNVLKFRAMRHSKLCSVLFLKLFAMVIWKIYQQKLQKIPPNLGEKYFQEEREICLDSNYTLMPEDEAGVAVQDPNALVSGGAESGSTLHDYGGHVQVGSRSISVQQILQRGSSVFKVYFAGKPEAAQEPCGWRTCLTLSPTIPKSCLVHAQRLVPALGPVVPVPAALRT